MSTLARIIANLPAYFDSDPGAVPALTIYRDGLAGDASLVGRSLLVRDGSGQVITVSLAGKTVAMVAADLNAHAGYTALVTEGQSSLPADAFVAVAGDLAVGVTLSCFTSLLWRVLAPIAWAIEETLANIRAGVEQLAIPTAGGPWLDLWGDLYGGVQRRATETEATYAARIMREVRRVRLTIPALAAMIQEELGVHAEIRNLFADAWVIGETKFGILAGRRHARTTFEVRVDRTATVLSTYFDAQLRYLVDRNRAAGTLPFYVSINRGGNGVTGPTVVAETHGQLVSTVGLSRPLTWVIGQGQLGQQWLSLPANVGAVVTVTTRTSSGQGEPLILGEDRLGVTQLGQGE